MRKAETGSARPEHIRGAFFIGGRMSQRVVSLTVHRNTIARRRAKEMRERAMRAARIVVEDHGSAEGFVVAAMSRDGRFQFASSLPEGTPASLWRSMMSELIDHVTE